MRQKSVRPKNTFFVLLFIFGFWFIIGIGLYILGAYFNYVLLQELAFGGLLLGSIGTPLIFLELAGGKWQWIDNNKGWIGFLFWLFSLIFIYFIVVPKLGLTPVNCEEYPHNIFCNY